ncbi:hypothetical protein KI387_009117 [Taxus chinensis]|uniref:Uncharacterized protein n=1 Tax=Taxus chinensis TaxID=29808 RepID=A0AA38CWL7_TAXCH|nr:hypothetical protein KI387_009117 [Taxus chinensis]
MEHLNAQVSSLYGMNMGEYGDPGGSSMMAFMTAHQGDGEGIITARVPLHSLHNGQAAEILPVFQNNKLQRQSQAIMEQQVTVKPVTSVPPAKIEGGCHGLPNRLRFDKDNAVDCFPESTSVHFVSQTPETDNIRFSSGSRTSPFTTDGDEEEVDAVKAKILAHPQYHSLLEAYFNCQKVGAPPEVVAQLEDAVTDHENQLNQRTLNIEMDPELDRFMEAYREMFSTYKDELTKPFDEAMSFFNTIETQLNSLTNGTISISPSAESDDKRGGGSSEEEECSTVEMEYEEVVHNHSEDRELKDRLLRKYSGYLSSLRQEFMKKKKKGKLPKDSRQTLLDWWNLHYKWPYPSETEKVALAERTGLDQKQINNWFINQRKRHWKPSEDAQFVLMDTRTPHTTAFFMERHS